MFEILENCLIWKRIFTDMISIAFQIAILIVPTQMTISGCYIVVLVFKLKMSIDDIHGMEVYLFKK